MTEQLPSAVLASFRDVFVDPPPRGALCFPPDLCAMWVTALDELIEDVQALEAVARAEGVIRTIIDLEATPAPAKSRRQEAIRTAIAWSEGNVVPLPPRSALVPTFAFHDGRGAEVTQSGADDLWGGP